LNQDWQDFEDLQDFWVFWLEKTAWPSFFNSSLRGVRNDGLKNYLFKAKKVKFPPRLS